MSALQSNLWDLLGQVVLHSLWQGALVALLAAGFLRALRDRDPRERYAVGWMALLLVAAMPVVTFLWLQANTHVHVAADPGPMVAVAPGAAPASTPTPTPGALAWVAWVWIVGAIVQQLRLMIGYGRLSGLKRRGLEAPPAKYQSLVAELAEAMGVARRVRLAISERVHVPSLVGWLEPVVLVPVGALNQLSTAEVRAVLAHELAHLKRLDPLLNGIQSVLETVFFYHPAVWWISRRVREEREYCCDDLAAAVCGDGVTLARALANLESSRTLPAALALSSQGGSLMQRVRRLVTPGTRRGGRASMAVPALFLASSMALTAGSASAWSANHDDECARCKARLERKAARKAAKASKDDVWVTFRGADGEETVSRWVTTVPSGEYLFWNEAKPTKENVFEWTEAAPKAVFQWSEKAPDVAEEVVLEWAQPVPTKVDFSIPNVECQAPDVSKGQVFLKALDGEDGAYVYVTSFAGETENVFFNEVVDFSEGCQDEPVAVDFTPGRQVTWQAAIEELPDLAEQHDITYHATIEASEPETGNVTWSTPVNVNTAQPIVVDRLLAPDAETWVRISSDIEERINAAGETDYFVRATGTVEGCTSDVEVQDLLFQSMANFEACEDTPVTGFFVAGDTEAPVTTGRYVQLEDGQDALVIYAQQAFSGDGEVILINPETGANLDYYRVAPTTNRLFRPGRYSTVVTQSPQRAVVEVVQNETIDLTEQCEAEECVEVTVTPQIWVDTVIKDRAAAPADEDADLRRQIDALRKELDRLEKQLDAKDGSVSWTDASNVEVDLSFPAKAYTQDAARFWTTVQTAPVEVDLSFPAKAGK